MLHVLYFVSHISGVMISMLASSVVGLGFKPWSGQTKDNKIGICYFSLKQHVDLIQSEPSSHLM